MTTTTKTRAQIHMDDNIIRDEELEQLLEDRQADKKAKDKIRSMETPTPYRVGRFIIAKQAVAAKSVAFETTESSRLTIKTVGEE